MTELEKKLLLTKDEYDYLMEHLGYESPLVLKPIATQINYYFDTDDFSMNRQNTTCRIRLKDGEYKATMKKHLFGTEHSIETEMEIHNGLESNAFTNMGLKLQGELITKRCVIFKDGYSGLNFNRPSFKRLIQDLEDGKFNTVITKDLSRLGRDYIQTGYYIDIYFTSKRVRYIAVNDGIDTQHENNDIAPFKNILNEWFS